MEYLITGGLGFIGQHLTKQLLERGHVVRIVDNMSPQVHSWKQQDFLGSEIRICDFADVEQYQDLLDNCEHLIHLAAETGTGQSMYQISRYCEQNINKFATLLEALTKISGTRLKSVTLSSSRSIYGEGAYTCNSHGRFIAPARSKKNLVGGKFDAYCPNCGSKGTPVATKENDLPSPLSVYAATKLAQESLLSSVEMPENVLKHIFRFQNVYGPGQSLTNPYTGILAIFSNLSKVGERINVFEDGLESRDFVHVQDVARLMIEVMDKQTTHTVCNIGTGKPVAVIDIAKKVNNYFGDKSEIVLTGQSRVGDIRHNFACLDTLDDILSTPFEFIPLRTGILSFLDWATSQKVETNIRYKDSLEDLQRHNLLLNSEIISK